MKIKTWLVFVITTIMLITPFSSIAYSNLEKKIEAPVKIFMPNEIKEIRKELTIHEIKELLHLFNETKEAIKLLNKNISYGEKMKANKIIDTFLYKMKKNELLGNLTVNQAKRIILGEHFQDVEIGGMDIKALSDLFRNGWEINAFCYLFAEGPCGIYTIYPSNFVLYLIAYILTEYYPSSGPGWLALIFDLLFIFTAGLIILSYFPHPTTIGLWEIMTLGIPRPRSNSVISTVGLLGMREKISRIGITAITIGFTGIWFFKYAIGHCVFIAFK